MKIYPILLSALLYGCASGGDLVNMGDNAWRVMTIDTSESEARRVAVNQAPGSAEAGQGRCIRRRASRNAGAVRIDDNSSAHVGHRRRAGRARMPVQARGAVAGLGLGRRKTDVRGRRRKLSEAVRWIPQTPPVRGTDGVRIALPVQPRFHSGPSSCLHNWPDARRPTAVRLVRAGHTRSRSGRGAAFDAAAATVAALSARGQVWAPHGLRPVGARIDNARLSEPQRWCARTALARGQGSTMRSCVRSFSRRRRLRTLGFAG